MRVLLRPFHDLSIPQARPKGGPAHCRPAPDRRARLCAASTEDDAGIPADAAAVEVGGAFAAGYRDGMVVAAGHVYRPWGILELAFSAAGFHPRRGFSDLAIRG